MHVICRWNQAELASILQTNASLMRLFVFGCGPSERGRGSDYSSPTRVVIFNVATSRSVNLPSVPLSLPSNVLMFMGQEAKKTVISNKTQPLFLHPAICGKLVEIIYCKLFIYLPS